MPVAFTAERAALLKILLHAAAHPSQTVNGILLGKVGSRAAPQDAQRDAPGSPRPTAQPTVEILDVLPLFHSYTTLAPMTEVALIQADAFARSQGLVLVGYYQANERVDDLELGSAGKKIADRIQSQTPQATTILVDNSVLKEYLQGKHPTFFQAFAKEEKRGWVAIPESSFLSDQAAVPGLFMDCFTTGKHHEIVDFDDHLDNVKKPWVGSTALQL